MGATFPCALHLVAGGPARLGRDVGWVYGANTLGAIVGTTLGGFILIPHLGLQRALLLAALANAAIVCVLLAARGTRIAAAARLALAGAVAAVGVGAWGIPSWDQRLLTSGPAVYAALYAPFSERGAFRDLTRRQELLFYEDGPGGTVSVHREGRTLALRINGKTDAGNGSDMRTQRMSGHLPLLFHPAPRRVFVLGLGSGVTVGAVLAHPVDVVEVVEIEPAVARAARFFDRESRGALEDPRVRLVVGDARHRLATSPERYDVMILEASNPWIRGLATLFTREFYAIVRSRLRPGGVVLQWMQGYGLTPADFAMVLRTFREAFPHATVWNTVPSDYLVVGSPDPLRLDLERVARRLASAPRFQADLVEAGVRSPVGLLADFVLAERDTARFAGEGPMNADDLLPLEYSAPRSLYRDTVGENATRLAAARTEGPGALTGHPELLETPPARYEIARALSAKGAPGEAIGHLTVALQYDPGFLSARVARARAFLLVGKPRDALADLASIPNGERVAEALALRGRAYAALGNIERAEEVFRQALAAGAGVETRVALGQVEARLGRTRDAVDQFEAALALDPDLVQAYIDLSAVHAAAGAVDRAIATLDRGLRAHPDDPDLLARRTALLARSRAPRS
jgi:spermidine synthase